MTYIDSVAGRREGDGLRWGVESICDQLTELGAKIAPATYYEHRGRPPTAREVSDAELKPKIATVHAAASTAPGRCGSPSTANGSPVLRRSRAAPWSA